MERENKMDKLDGIKIKGYTDTWSEISRVTVPNDLDGETTYYLMENDEWGDETCYLVINKDQTEVYETYDNILQCLADESVIDYDDIDTYQDRIEESCNKDLKEDIKASDYDLPNDIEIDLDELGDINPDDDEELGYAIEEYLSNNYSFQAIGFNYDFGDKGKVVVTDIEWEDFPFDESLQKKLKESIEEKKKVYDWYKEYAPDDYQLENIDKEVTFDKVYDYYKSNGEDIERDVLLSHDVGTDEWLDSDPVEAIIRKAIQLHNGIDLPCTVTFKASEVALDTDDADEEEVADRLSDMLSDKYGYTHYGFNFEMKENENGEPSEFVITGIDWDVDDEDDEDIDLDF